MRKKIIIGFVIVLLLAGIGVGIYFIINSKKEVEDIKYTIKMEMVSNKVTCNKEKSGEELVKYKGNYYLFIKMGKRSTGGYLIELQDIKVSGKDVTITVNEKHPGETCTVTDALTYPYLVVKFNKKPNVKVKRNTITYDCKFE